MSELITWDWSFFSIELPVLAAVLVLLWQFKREQEQALQLLRHEFSESLAVLTDKVTSQRIIMAEDYVTKDDLQRFESRLTAQMCDDEDKNKNSIRRIKT